MNKPPSNQVATKMNNWIGLLIAASLALVAGVLNWKYLERKTTEIEMVSFMAIGDGVRVDPGDAFKESHFVSLDIPRKNSGYLKDSAVFFKDRDTVVGMKALRPYGSGDVILRQELKTPPAQLNLKPDELAMWVPVGSASSVSSLITPGDMVSFSVPKPGVMSRRPPKKKTEEETPEDPNEVQEWNFGGVQDQPLITAGETEIIGPFRVISVGQRLGSNNVSRASGVRGGNSNTLGIAIKRVGKGFEPSAEKLRNRVISVGFRHAGVLLHPRDQKK